MDMHSYARRVRRKKLIAFAFLLLTFFLNDLFLHKAPREDFMLVGLSVGVVILLSIFNRELFEWLWLAAGGTMLVWHINFGSSFSAQNSQIEGFSLTEYLTIFSAFIYGAVAARFFVGWGKLLRQTCSTVNFEYVLWTIFAFGLLIDIWWGQWDREHQISESVWKFMLTLVTPTFFYFLGVVLLPVNGVRNSELSAFYHRNKRTFFTLFALIMVSNFLVANILEKAEWNSVTNVLRMCGIVLAGAAVLTNGVWVHRIALILAWSLLITHIVV
jgi:hypothetical protein